IPTIRRTGPPDRDALQRPRPRVVQAVLLQEVPRIPPAACDGASPHRTRPSGGDLHLVRGRATISVQTGTEGPASDAREGSVRRRHVEFSRLAGQVLAPPEQAEAQPEEDGGG